MSRIPLSLCLAAALSASLLPSTNSRPRAAQANPSASAKEVQGILATKVEAFDNHSDALIPTLLRVAELYQVPMGIEQVTPEALHRGISVQLARGTVPTLLDLCVSRVAGYAWKVSGGVVLVYGPDELADPTNLLSLRLPDFTMRDATLNQVNNRLRDLVFTASATASATGTRSAPPTGPVGIGGDSPGLAAWEAKRVSIEMKDATVRDVLNRIVLLSGAAGQQVLWVASVPPDKLDNSPASGLWQFR